MIEIRTDLQSGYDSLCRQGQQLTEPHPTVELEDATFDHPDGGITPIKIDVGVLAQQGALYVGDEALQAALSEHGIDSRDSKEAAAFLAEHLNEDNDGLVWGFSGYATGGINPGTGEPFSYASEARGLHGLYDYLLEVDEAPDLAIDGGVSEGFLALNSVIAQSAGVPTLGFIPRQGLASVGIRDHMVVAGDTYPDRETLVGTADVLVCAGGAIGTIRECIYAARRGAAILIMDLADYPPNSLPKVFRTHEDLRQAYENERLVVCDSYTDIAESVDQILETPVKYGRPLRKSVISEHLT